MSEKFEKMSVFEQIRAGLEDSIAWTKGQISLKTTTLPAPPPAAAAEHISALRRTLKMSQAVFAATINVSPKTVQSWEQGTRYPSDAALRLLQLVALQPGIVNQFFAVSPRSSSMRTARRKATPCGARKSARAGRPRRSN
jgi:putative transcriptional regulator